MSKPSARLSSHPCRVTVLLSVLLALPLAAGAECFEKSPLAPPGADRYSAIEPNRLSKSQQKAVGSLFKSLRGHWRGKARGYFCEGTRKSPRKASDNATAEIDVESDGRDSVIITATLTAANRSSSRNELLRLILSGETLRVGRDTRAGETRVLSASGRQLAFAVKELHGRGGGVSGFREVHRSIRVSPSQLTIDFIVYSQGGLSSTSRWTARKR